MVSPNFITYSQLPHAQMFPLVPYNFSLLITFSIIVNFLLLHQHVFEFTTTVGY